MWKAKRVLILVIGVLVCLSSFAIYTLFLGAIDGLPPLEVRMLPGGPIDSEPPPPPGGIADDKLQMAYGPACKELLRPLRLWLPDKGVALAAGDFNIDKTDGRVRLAPFSAAIFHKNKVPGGFPEISTINCDVAILTLDKAITQHSELSGRKVIAVEMIGSQPGITLTNNRHTIEKNDDIDVLITSGHLFWEERQNKIWTDGVVCMTDHQTKPPTVIRGRKMDMWLTKDSSPYRPKFAKPQPASASASASNDTSNIERIKLYHDVQMHFWVEASSGFLGGTPNQKKPLQAESALQDLPDPKAIPPEKAHIDIHTGGSFVYDLTKEFAWFESPPIIGVGVGKAAKADDMFAPDQVHVQRRQKADGKEKFDQLTCDRLDLQFRRKINDANPADQSDGKEIETATATRRDVNEVVMALDSEGMAAFGSEMFYRAGDAVNGPLTIMKGDPLRTIKDGHKMVSKELHLFAANRFGEGQRAWAKGPGQIDLLDPKNPKKDTFPTHILWRDTLNVTKEKEGGQVFDLMVVTGEASFIDDLQKQELHGEKLSVWMLQVEESAKKPEAVGGSRQELHRVVAQDRVHARSPDFIVRRANILTMMFIPETARGDRLPDPVVVAKPVPKDEDGTKPPRKDNDGKELAPAPGENKGPVEEKKKPIELEGNEITVAITTLGTEKKLQELIAKGNVYVVQAGEKPGEKALDITGTLLTLKHADKGDVLVVYGEEKKAARLEVDGSVIWGPRVTVDQTVDRVEVEGAGGMDVPSNKNIDGTKSAGKNTRIRINWNKNMNFDGRIALAKFYGGVQTSEMGARSGALCQTLHAYLDKPVSFKEGGKDKQNAKIDKLVFEKNVYIDDTKVDDKGQFVQRFVLQGRELINFDGGRARAVGPGEVRNLGKGSSEQGLALQPAGPGGKAAPAKMEWKLTHVKFRDSMHTVTGEGMKRATFYGSNEGVEAFHFPTIKIEETMNADRPPKDGLYLRCGILEVEAKQIGERTAQIMIAKTNVTFRTDLYLGYADVVKYDETNDIVIFEGLNGNPVRLYEIIDNGSGPTTVPKSLTSLKVLYNRKTGKVDTEGVKSITN